MCDNNPACNILCVCYLCSTGRKFRINLDTNDKFGIHVGRAFMLFQKIVILNKKFTAFSVIHQ